MIRTPIDEFVRSARAQGIVLDSGVALLHFLGSYDRQLLRKVSRAAIFADEDVDTLARLLQLFKTVALTPHILTEVINLLGNLHDPARTGLLSAIHRPLATIQEDYQPSAELARDPLFPRLELTDTAVVALARRGYGVLTIDGQLYAELLRDNRAVLNFNHVRTWAWR